MDLKGPARVHQLDAEITQQPRDDLVDLEQGQVAADAQVTPAAKLLLHQRCQQHTRYSVNVTLGEREAGGKRTTANRQTYLEHVSLHPLRPLLVLEPALGAEVVGVVAKDLPIAVQDPAVARDGRAAGEEVAVELGALGRDQAGDVEPDGRAHAHGLLEARLQVVQLLRLVPVQVALGRDGALPHGLFDLVHDGLVDWLRVEDVPEEGLHGGGGRVGTGEAIFFFREREVER